MKRKTKKATECHESQNESGGKWKTQHEVFHRRYGYFVGKGGKKGMLTVKAESFWKFSDCFTMNHLFKLFLTNEKMFKKSLVDDVCFENDGR